MRIKDLNFLPMLLGGFANELRELSRIRPALSAFLCIWLKPLISSLIHIVDSRKNLLVNHLWKNSQQNSIWISKKYDKSCVFPKIFFHSMHLSGVKKILLSEILLRMIKRSLPMNKQIWIFSKKISIRCWIFLLLAREKLLKCVLDSKEEMYILLRR